MTTLMESNQLVKQKRPFRRSYIIYFLILVPLLLGACAGAGQSTSWPGLTAEENTVYIAYGPGVLAFDTDSQTQQWVYPLESNATLQFFAAPDVDNGRLVFGDYGAIGGFFNPSPTISIYGLEDNGSSVSEIWPPVEGLANDRIAAQPLIAGDVVYVGTSDNLLLALDLNSGEELWRFETEHSVWAQPTLVDDTLYVSSLDRHIYALDAATGEQKWTELLTGALSGKPIVENGLVILSNFDTKLHALDAETGDSVWVAESNEWVWSAPTVADGTVYFGDSSGAIFAVSLETGEQIWQQQAPGAVQTSPVVANGLVYIASAGPEESETGIVQALSVEDGTAVWDETTTAPVFTTPVIVNDILVVAVNSQSELLVGYDLERGTRQWSFLPES